MKRGFGSFAWLMTAFVLLLALGVWLVYLGLTTPRWGMPFARVI